MPRAVSNGGRDDELFAGLEEDALAWDTGLSQFLGRLEEELIRWHSEERVKAKDRQMKCLRAQKDLATAEASVREAAAPRELKGPEDQPWQDKLKELVNQAKEQRDEARQLLELIRSHTKLHLEPAGGAALLQRLPSEGQPLASSAEELPKYLKLFLELAEKQPAETPEGRHRRGEGGKGTKDGEKKKRKGVAKKAKAEKRCKARPMRSAGASLDSDWSSSRSASLSERRRERRGRHRRYTPSVDSRSFSDSRSASLSQSRAPMRRRPHLGQRPGPRPGKGGGGMGRYRGGAGGGGRRDDADVSKDIDRFVHVNKLESRCEKILRDLSPALARQVMGFSGGSNTFELSGDVRDPTAVVLARVRKATTPGSNRPRQLEDRPRGGGPPRRPRSPRRGAERGGAERGGRGRSFSSRSRSRSRSNGGRGPPGGRQQGGRGQQTGSNAIPLGKPREFGQKEEEKKEEA